jgi:glycosyltransferase involved in cell wall biosynthesis
MEEAPPSFRLNGFSHEGGSVELWPAVSHVQIYSATSTFQCPRPNQPGGICIAGLGFEITVSFCFTRRMTPLVSIIIPTLDRPRYLREAIDAALAQTYRRIEVLVFDNGDLEETRAIGEEAAGRDSRVRFRRNKHNLGMSGNFNALAAAAEGEFLVAIGDDDRLLPEFVGRLVEAMRPNVRMAFSNHYLIDSEGRRLAQESVAYSRQYGRDALPAGVLQNPEAAAWRQSIPMSASLLRTADMQRLGFREDLNTPDAEFFIRLAREGGGFFFLPEYLMEYRVHLGAETAAGLWSEQLVDCLTPLEVKPELEPYKRQFLAPKVVNAVSRCLQRGNMERARRFLENKYYPRRRRAGKQRTGTWAQPVSGSLGEAEFGVAHELRFALGSLLQRFCASLPAAIGAPIYRVARSVSLTSKRGRLER